MPLSSPLDRQLDAWLPNQSVLDGKVAEYINAIRNELEGVITGLSSGTLSVKAFGGRGKKETSTGSMVAGSAVITGIESSKFPVGTYLAIDGAGARSTTGSISAASQILSVADATGFECEEW
jgi:hypothetical protein